MDELGARLIAILPFPPSEFCADFVTEDSRQEFSDLLNEAAGVFEVTLPPDENWKKDGEARDVQYARVGAVIAEQSQILIALWEGRPARTRFRSSMRIACGLPIGFFTRSSSPQCLRSASSM